MRCGPYYWQLINLEDHPGLKLAPPMDLDHRDGLNSPKKKKSFDIQQITNKEPSIIEWTRCGPYYWQLINLEDHRALKVTLPLDLDYRDGLNSPQKRKQKSFDVQQITNKEPSIIEWMRIGPYYWQLIWNWCFLIDLCMQVLR